MSALAGFLIGRSGRSAARRLAASAADPRGSQLRKLMEIVGRNRDTEYGREHGFASIRSLADYRERVPVVGYEEIRQQIERIVRGERNVLTAENPRMFARTSATTGAAKYIPVTPACGDRDHRDPMRAWMWHALRDHPSIFRGKVVSLVSPAVEGTTECGLPFGSTSGHIYKHMPRLIRGTYAIPYETFLIQDYAAKYYTVMRVAIASDVTLLATANPSSIVKLCEVADAESEGLLRDIADGTLRAELEIPSPLRRAIEGRLRRDPAGARRLEKARSLRGGRLLPVDYWPRLALIGCWKGGTVGAYLSRFPEWFDPLGERPLAVRDWGYLSSEARGSVPLHDDGSAGVLTVDTNVFEFVAAAELEARPEERDSWEFLDVTELEEGSEYYVFVTTTGGLYRYDMNDVVEVAGRFQATPTIVFRRKGRGMTSITGEKLSVNQLIEAFANVSGALGLPVLHFKAEPDVEQARYVFKVEAASWSESDGRRFVVALDSELSRLNLEYKSKRDSLRLGRPRLQLMKPGWYDRRKQARIAAGGRLFQAKTVLLDSAEPHFPEPDELVFTIDA